MWDIINTWAKINGLRNRPKIQRINDKSRFSEKINKIDKFLVNCFKKEDIYNFNNENGLQVWLLEPFKRLEDNMHQLMPNNLKVRLS